MSHLAWLDTSESERRRMMHVIDLFQQKGTVDELGLGGIRDTISDWLSPGTSTIQTRARYFFFIPWIYLSLERRDVPAERAGTLARSMEINLAAVLRESTDAGGTIGVNAGAALKRLASSVYWAGLKRLGFRLFDGPQDRYHRRFGTSTNIAFETDSDGEPRSHTLSPNWNPHLPRAPEGFPKGMSLALNKEEAEFLSEQLALHAPQSLLQFLVEARESGVDTNFPWELPAVADMNPVLQSWLRHARCYSDLMWGAALLYNLMLAEKSKRDALRESFKESLEGWAALVEDRRAELSRWSRSEFWSLIRRENPRSSPPAERFSNQWIDAVMSSRLAGQLKDDATIRRCIEEREYQLKGPRARLKSAAHLELWGGASGAEKFNYRWGITRIIAGDVIAGLQA